ncbi:hypothetical protein GCM10017612_30180 [Novosphingobium resinovorum]|nr:hypothetical protein GCM10017612_30180 [Novosphingobium resinovorum]
MRLVQYRVAQDRQGTPGVGSHEGGNGSGGRGCVGGAVHLLPIMGKSRNHLKHACRGFEPLCVFQDCDSLTSDLIAVNGIVSRALRKPG